MYLRQRLPLANYNSKAERTPAYQIYEVSLPRKWPDIQGAQHVEPLKRDPDQISQSYHFHSFACACAGGEIGGASVSLSLCVHVQYCHPDFLLYYLWCCYFLLSWTFQRLQVLYFSRRETSGRCCWSQRIEQSSFRCACMKHDKPETLK